MAAERSETPAERVYVRCQRNMAGLLSGRRGR
jgi:hypothetical protein